MIDVEVVIAYSGNAERRAVQLPTGSTVKSALIAADCLQRLTRGEFAAVGIFGQAAPLDVILKDGDRVELYRPLQRDPREARRELAAKGLDITQRSS